MALTFNFFGHDVSASKAFGKIGKAADRLQRDLEKSGKGYSKAGLLAGAALGGGLALAAKSMKDFTQAAIEDQSSQTKLAVALRNNAGATKASVAATEDWITKTASATGVADDHLRPALVSLVGATKDAQKAQTIMGTALDIAAAKGLPVETVAKALSKAYQGNTAGLARLGLATKDASGHALTFQESMVKLNEQFGGQASAHAKTLQGQTERLKNTWHETQETVGYKLIPVLTKLSNWILTKGIPALHTFGMWVQRNRTWLKPLVAVIGTAVAVIYLVSKAIKAWAAAQAVLNVVLDANPIGLVVIALAALAVGLIYAYRHSEKFRTIVRATFTAIKGYVQTLAKVWVAEFHVVTAVIEGVWSVVQRVAGAIKGLIKDVGKVAGIAGKIGGGITSHLPHFASGGYIPARPGGHVIVAGDGGEGEYVIPESKIGRAGAGGGNTYIYNINSPVTDEQAARRLIQKIARLHGHGDVQVAFGS